MTTVEYKSLSFVLVSDQWQLLSRLFAKGCLQKAVCNLSELIEQNGVSNPLGVYVYPFGVSFNGLQAALLAIGKFTLADQIINNWLSSLHVQLLISYN